MLTAILSISLVAPFGDNGRERLLDAIRAVESGGRSVVPRGDDGRARGPYQIWRSYWIDSGVAGRYEDVDDAEYSRRVVRAYWSRYAPKNASHETLARIHNGGPRGHMRAATMQYWRRVKRAMR